MNLTTIKNLRSAALAGVIALSAAPALAQVKAALPRIHHPGSPTPWQRSFPSRPAPAPHAPAGSGGGVVVGGGNGFVGGSVNSGSGLTVNGAYNGEQWDVAFHLGADSMIDYRVTCPNGIVWGYPYSYYGGYGYYDGYYDNSYAVIDGALVQPVVTQPAPAEPAEPAAPPPEPPTDVEVAAGLLKSGDAQGAIDKYRLHLRDNADDAEAMRALSVALIQEAEFDQAVAMMSMAYRTAPSLTDVPLATEPYFKKDADLRSILQKSVGYANRVKTASSWLTVAVLMQAEGREEPALRMIARAEELGLDAALVKQFKAALGG